MKSKFRILAGVVGCLLIAPAANAQQADSPKAPKAVTPKAVTPKAVTPKAEPAKPATPQTTTPASEVQAVVAAYVAAFNRGDVEALMSHWSKDGVYTTGDEDKAVRGRESLKERFDEIFKSKKSAPKLEVSTTSIEFISPRVALERGHATVSRPQGPNGESRYEVVYVKDGRTWLIDQVREEHLSVEESRYERLKGLEWMIGEWVDAGEGFSIEIDCDWTANRSYIRRKYSVSDDEGFQSSGVQIMGWDPKQRQIRSWLFDSEGGFISGVWTQRDDRWVVQSVATLADGSTGSYTSIFRPFEDGSYAWQKINRVLDGAVLPNLDEVIVQRK